MNVISFYTFFVNRTFCTFISRFSHLFFSKAEGQQHNTLSQVHCISVSVCVIQYDYVNHSGAGHTLKCVNNIFACCPWSFGHFCDSFQNWIICSVVVVVARSLLNSHEKHVESREVKEWKNEFCRQRLVTRSCCVCCGMIVMMTHAPWSHAAMMIRTNDMILPFSSAQPWCLIPMLLKLLMLVQRVHMRCVPVHVRDGFSWTNYSLLF